MSIARHRPDATLVKGFRQWLKLNRCVKKGEEGIPIFVPIWVNAKDKMALEIDEDGKTLWFKIAYVFDIKQTDSTNGEEWNDPDLPRTNDHVDTYDLIIEYAKSLGLEYNEVAGLDARGNTDGSNVINVDSYYATDAKAKIVIHEIAHVILDHKQRQHETSKMLREVEAESTAYVVGSLLDLPVDGSQLYLVTYGAKGSDLKEAYSRIVEAVKVIYGGLTGDRQEVNLQAVA